jgi:hypothetical protein
LAGYEFLMFYVPLELVSASYLGDQWGITLAGNGGINMVADDMYGGWRWRRRWLVPAGIS